MHTSTPVIRIPASAIRELESVEEMDWSEGLSLDEMLGWVNDVAARFRPPEIGDDSRSSREFSARTFRHYQTLGCIDAPERVGRSAVYRFRHYLQALLLRKLLWERLPSDKIAALMKDRATADLKQLLLQGIEVVAAGRSRAKKEPAQAADETWKRITITPGIELHLRSGHPKPTAAEIPQILKHIESTLRKS